LEEINKERRLRSDTNDLKAYKSGDEAIAKSIAAIVKGLKDTQPASLYPASIDTLAKFTAEITKK
jgi:hypothetical protein